MEFLENEAESSFTQIFYQVGALLNFHLQKQCLVHIFILKICVCFVYFKKIKLLSKTWPKNSVFCCSKSYASTAHVLLCEQY